MNHRRRLLTLGLAGALAFTSFAAPAIAQDEGEDPPTPAEQLEDAWEEARQKVLNGVKEHAQAAVDHRIATLAELTTWVTRNEHTTGSHASQLLSEFASTEVGLLALNDEIQATTTVEEALQLTQKIASDYRVYLVMVPKTAEVIVGDTLVAVTGQVDEAIDGIQEIADALAEYGLPIDEIQAALDDARAHGAAASALADDVASQAIGLTATDWPSPAESTLRAGKGDLEASAKEIRISVERLKDAIHLIRRVAEGNA